MPLLQKSCKSKCETQTMAKLSVCIYLPESVAFDTGCSARYRISRNARSDNARDMSMDPNRLALCIPARSSEQSFMNIRQHCA